MSGSVDADKVTNGWTGRLAALRGRAVGFLVPYVAAVSGAAAWAEEHARAVAYTDYFGLPYVVVDPRHAFVPFALVALFFLPATWLVLSFLRAIVAAMTLQLLPLFAIFVLAVPPYGLAGLQADLIVIAAVLVGLALINVAPHVGRLATAVDARLDRHERATAALRRLAQTSEAISLRPLAPVLWSILLGAIVVLGAAALGHWFGMSGAAAQDEFKVVRRDPATQTMVVTFIDGDRSIERKLDVSPSADGTPRNTWLPAVTIRPVPATGLSYELVELGRTTRAEPADG